MISTQLLPMIIHEPTVTYTKKTVETILMDNADNCAVAFRKYYATNDLDPTIESVVVAFLNRKNYVIKMKTLSIGGVNSCLIDTKIVLREALLHSCSAFIVCHNHPSGDPTPSSADHNMTRKIREASQAIDIIFMDHIVLGEPDNDPNHVGRYSFREAGII